MLKKRFPCDGPESAGSLSPENVPTAMAETGPPTAPLTPGAGSGTASWGAAGVGVGPSSRPLSGELGASRDRHRRWAQRKPSHATIPAARAHHTTGCLAVLARDSRRRTARMGAFRRNLSDSSARRCARGSAALPGSPASGWELLLNPWLGIAVRRVLVADVRPATCRRWGWRRAASAYICTVGNGPRSARPLVWTQIAQPPIKVTNSAPAACTSVDPPACH
mmetsp:Transcript_11578/g.20918  ORF Transcript_11578/g.20918 Transcript_11578/m.20918 type:complete len:222 (+) Transcript_11578:1497-2162(+)